MSEEAARAAVGRMRTDEAFRERVTSVGDVDERRAVLVTEGYDRTGGELAAQAGALDDDSLDLVNGGFDTSPRNDETHHLL